MAEKKVLLPASQRAILFAQATREYKVDQPAKIYSSGQTVRFDLPKSRFLSKILLRVKGTFKAKHATKTSFVEMGLGRYNILNQIRISINNGFNPYQLSGKSLKAYNMVSKFQKPQGDNFGVEVFENVVSVAGATNKVNFTMELPLTLNERDCVGLLMLQNDETYVTVEIDLGSILSCMVDSDIVIESENITITPVLHTFSIPRDENAIPDYSV
ncbi:MAG TPA: hypothetical protein VF870_12295, partial [Ignavibacteriaceae bacterium]